MISASAMSRIWWIAYEDSVRRSERRLDVTIHAHVAAFLAVENTRRTQDVHTKRNSEFPTVKTAPVRLHKTEPWVTFCA